MRNVPSPVARNLYWASQRLRGRAAVRERLRVLEYNETLTAHQLAEVQAEKLRRLIDHAYRTVPYYRRVMGEAGLTPADVQGPADLCRLPLLTRTDLRTHQADLLSSAADRATLQTNYSSGSTGLRAEFIQDQDFRLWMRAHQLRTYQWCSGWRLGDPFALLWGSEIYWSFKQIADRIDNLMTNRREFNTFELSPRLISRFAESLAAFQPTLISTYSNAMHLIAREVQRTGMEFPRLRAVQGTSEPLPPALRERIGQVLDCEVYDKYGSRETNIVSHEAPDHTAMLIQSENVVVEILDDDGRPCPPGVRGRVVLTTLNNNSMPLIRYETSDVAALEERPDSYTGPFPVMSSVAGRLQDLIITPSGSAIDSYFFSYLLMRFEEVLWFQIVQTEPESLTLRIYTERRPAAERLEEIRHQIHRHTGYPFKLDIELLDSMPASPTGKFRLCVSELGASTIEQAQQALSGTPRARAAK
ncbi:phenylacetate--CoA ligase family protein [Streptomyces tibetensis]|uniref:phenylacetate--CoA ligase family protein n=1 Tax=Streptomyces tibetensis TaxID=2382123 RepID=UPI0034061F60